MERALTPNQKKAVRQVTDLFEIISAAEIADEAIKAANDGEAARLACLNIKGSLSRRIKLALHINRVAAQKLAIRAGLAGDTTYNKNKCLTLQKENEELKKEVERLSMIAKSQVTTKALIHEAPKEVGKQRTTDIKEDSRNSSANRKTKDKKLNINTMNDWPSLNVEKTPRI